MLPQAFGRLRLERIESEGLDDTTFLTLAERRRLDTISHPLRRRQFIAGRALTRQLLRRVRKNDAFDHALELTASGQPLLHQQSGLHVSISHSGEWVACALANLPIGLDIERIEHKRATTELIQQVCSEEEQTLFESLPDECRERLFTELWTLKEAWLKLHGAALDIERMRAIKWTTAVTQTGNCASWTTTDGLSVTVLGPPARVFLGGALASSLGTQGMKCIQCTIRQVEVA